MKKFKYLFAIPLVAALTACSSDEPAPTPDGAEMPFYTTMSITLPSTDTRAIEGEEIGQDVENKINNVKVVLTTRTGAAGSYTYTKLMESHEAEVVNGTTYTVMFDASELDEKATDEEMEVYAFVVCNDNGYNCTNGFEIDKTFNNGAPASFSASQSPLRMTSAPYAAKLPKKSVLLKSDTKEKAYDLTASVNGGSGPIKVERSVARFDYKVSPNNNTFEIKQGNVVRGKIQITDMALINENKEVYYFGRTTNDGTNTNPITHELVAAITNVDVAQATSLKYVVCPLALSDRTSDKFNYPMNNQSEWSWTSIASLTQDDNHQGGWDPTTAEAKKEYKIWRYCNENAIPAKDKTLLENKNQTNGVTTGIVFKGQLINGEDKPIPGFDKGHDLYRYRQIIYGDFEALYKAAYPTNPADVNPDLRAAFDKTWEESADGTYVAGEKKFALKADQTRGGNGFTVYVNKGTEAAPVYPVYYYYWNRHDNNGVSNKMGAMEFSVVRNNVYKLYIESINLFGCSGTEDDPDKPDPDDPDETEHMYIKVDVQVMPWTVRYSGVIF